MLGAVGAFACTGRWGGQYLNIALAVGVHLGDDTAMVVNEDDNLANAPIDNDTSCKQMPQKEQGKYRAQYIPQYPAVFCICLYKMRFLIERTEPMSRSIAHMHGWGNPER